jgi:hypothetical protein
MSKLENLLLKTINDSIKLKSDSTYSQDHTHKLWSKDQYPMTKEEVLEFEYRGKLHSCFGFIPESLYNKQYKIGNDLKLYVQYHRKLEESEPFYSRGSHGIQGHSAGDSRNCNIILEYHGYYYLLGKYYDSISLRFSNIIPEQTNWHWLTFTEEKPWVKDEESISHSYSYCKTIEEIITTLLEDEEKIEITEALPFFEYYDWNGKDKISDFYKKETDVEWYIFQDTKDGVFKPSSNFIDHILFAVQKQHKNLLKDLGIHTIQLRSKQYFAINNFFDIDHKTMEIKAPKNIIKSYGFEKYSKDESTLKEIAEEKRIVKEKEQYFKHHNTFTLSQHGKVIFKAKDKDDIIEYLENHTVKYPYKNVKTITQTSQITKDLKEAIGLTCESDCSKLTFEELQSSVRENDYDSVETTDGDYLHKTYTMNIGKYILELNGSRYMKDQSICDEELDDTITVKQLY